LTPAPAGERVGLSVEMLPPPHQCRASRGGRSAAVSGFLAPVTKAAGALPGAGAATLASPASEPAIVR